MQILGFHVPGTKAAVGPTTLPTASGAGWHNVFSTSDIAGTGAWQRGLSSRRNSPLAFFAAYACVTRIANDISKLGVRVVHTDDNGVKAPANVGPWQKVISTPNNYHLTMKKFVEKWMLSKLTDGNTYALKMRNSRGHVVALYILEPSCVTLKIAPGPVVFYELNTDALSPVQQKVTVPASEIIHDYINPLFHDLQGCSPLYAAALSAHHGLAVQGGSAQFFENQMQPGGVLEAPGRISEPEAERIKKDWTEKFTGKNRGRLLVVGEGLSFKTMSMAPKDAELMPQLKYDAEQVCSAYSVPAWRVGVGPTPEFKTAETQTRSYYTDCLQTLIEDFQQFMTHGLNLPANHSVDCNLDDLIKMDAETKVKLLGDTVKSGLRTHNEGRAGLNLEPKPNADQLFMQEQNKSLPFLSWQEAQEMANAAANAANNSEPPPPDVKALAYEFRKALKK